MNEPAFPTDDSRAQIGFTPRRHMVGWFNPQTLLDLGARAGLATLVRGFSDRRETFAALDPDSEWYDYRSGAADESFWLDYVSDLGDAFGPTYAVASVIGQDRLELDDLGGRPVSLERGNVLVLGGDEAYPIGNAQTYHDQLRGPYRAALPWTEAPHPDVFAIPGNHDWYDGLSAFSRTFFQNRWFGGWRTRQKRSYFALRLPRGWWLWAADLQLDGEIDGPQIDYFRRAALAAEPGDRVVLAIPEPVWAKETDPQSTPARNLDYLIEIAENATSPMQIEAMITGDHHHYARYESKNGPTLVTAGMGGAYTSATHNLAPSPALYPNHTIENRYPSASVSRRMRWRNMFGLLRPTRNANLLRVICAFAMLMASLTWWTVKSGGDDLLESARDTNPFSYVGRTVSQIVTAPFGAALAGFILVALLLFAANSGLAGGSAWQFGRQTVKKLLLGAVHSAAHLALLLIIFWVIAQLVSQSLVAVAATAVLATFGSALLFGVYFAVSDLLLGVHTNETFATGANRGHKGFLRMAIGPDGGLECHVIAIDNPPRHWTITPRNDRRPGMHAWLAPRDDQLEPRILDSFRIP